MPLIKHRVCQVCKRETPLSFEQMQREVLHGVGGAGGSGWRRVTWRTCRGCFVRNAARTSPQKKNNAPRKYARQQSHRRESEWGLRRTRAHRKGEEWATTQKDQSVTQSFASKINDADQDKKKPVRSYWLCAEKGARKQAGVDFDEEGETTYVGRPAPNLWRKTAVAFCNMLLAIQKNKSTVKSFTRP